jgi:hypothetical protein
MKQRAATFLAGMAALIAAGTPVSAGLVDTRTDTNTDGATPDGAISANEYGAGNAYSYTGGGGGFGGPVGSGSLYMESDATNLYIGFQPGNTLNDNVVIHMDTRTGGFADSQMNDTADPGRNLLSNLTRDVDDPFPVGMTNGLPDFGVVIGQFGIVLFELNAGSTPGHLQFLQYDGAFTGNNPALAREIAIPLGSIGSPSVVDFFVSYGSDTNFMSNESIPVEAFNGGPNPGFDNNGTFAPVFRDNFDRFVVPEPASLGLLAFGGLALLGRRGSRRRD